MATNNRCLLIAGESGMGKSVSLMNMRNQEGVLYINCEAGKDLPFKNKFVEVVVTDPYEIHDIFERIVEKGPGQFHTVVIDTISFMMDMFESVHIRNSTNTQSAWGDYAEFFRKLMQEFVAKADINVVMLGHQQFMMDETSGLMRRMVPVKGALGKKGLEAFFTVVIVADKVSTSTLDNYENDDLNITQRDRDLGYKHVFQTLTTKKTVGDRIRTPMALFKDEETYIDNDAQVVLDRLNDYYA